MALQLTLVVSVTAHGSGSSPPRKTKTERRLFLLAAGAVVGAAAAAAAVPNLFRQSLRQAILDPISKLHSRTSSTTSSRRTCACVRPPDLAHRRLQEQEEDEVAKPLPVPVAVAAAPVQPKARRPAR